MVEVFRRGLREGNVVEGENASIEFRWASGDCSRLHAFAADPVGRRVAVIAAVGEEPSALAAKRATSTIPIVFGIGGDPLSPAQRPQCFGSGVTKRKGPDDSPGRRNERR